MDAKSKRVANKNKCKYNAKGKAGATVTRGSKHPSFALAGRVRREA